MERPATGCTVKDVPAAEFVTTYAAYLKRVGLVEVPAWVDTIKTAPRKELAPYDQDWFYIRIGKSPRLRASSTRAGVATLPSDFPCGLKRPKPILFLLVRKAWDRLLT